MSITEVNVISILAALIVFVSYLLYLIIRSRRRLVDVKTRWEKRVQESAKVESVSEGMSGGSDAQDNKLIKTKSPSDSYFTSKMPKVEGLNEWILHAGIELNPFIFYTTWLVLGILIGAYFYIGVKSGILLSILIGILSIFLLPWICVTYLTHRRRNLFLQEFPHALDMIRRALKSGHSVDRALEMVVEHAGGPVGAAFKRITEKMRLGETPENVLAETANRVGVDDFRMLAIVIVLQRETGGSLAEAIDNFSKIIRARQNLRKKISALSAEGRVSAIVLISIPFVVLGAVFLTTPSYLDPLFNTGTGQNLLIVAALMMAAGIGTILRMVYREIY